jgi:hypothetical protein
MSKKNKMIIKQSSLEEKLIIIRKVLSRSSFTIEDSERESFDLLKSELLSILLDIANKLKKPGQDWSCFPFSQKNVDKEDHSKLSLLIDSLENEIYEDIGGSLEGVKNIISKYRSHACLQKSLSDVNIGLRVIPLLQLFWELKKLKDPGSIPNKLSELSTKFIKIKTDIRPKIHVGIVIVLYVVYAAIFAVFALPIQLLVLGSILLGGSILTNLLFGLIVSAIMTTVAITVLQIKNNIDSNKLFYLLLLGFIFAAFAFTAPINPFLSFGLNIDAASMISRLVFGLVAAIIAHNVLDIINSMLAMFIPSIILNKLLFIRSLIIELLLSLLFIPVGDLLLKISLLFLQLVKNDLIANISELDVIGCFSTLLIMLSLYLMSVFFMPSICPVLIPLLVTLIELFIIYCDIMLVGFIEGFLMGGEITWPKWYNSFIGFVSEIFSNLSDFIATTYSVVVTIQNIAHVYHSNILVRLDSPKTNVRYLLYLDYFLVAITFILQIIINIVPLLIFIILYPIYKIADITAQNMQEFSKQQPKITILLCITTMIVCATFSSPIQLFVLGNIVVSGSAVTNILFGSMSGLVSTLLSANVYMIANNQIKPILLNACNSAYETYVHFYGSTNESFNSSCSDRSKYQ